MNTKNCVGFCFIAAAFLAVQVSRAAEATWNYAVQVSATVETSPPKITLAWPQDSQGTPNNYVVSRKLKNATSWGPGVTLSGATTSYVDTGVTIGSAYEYQVYKSASSYAGYGYIYAGINVPATEDRGKVVLLVDNSFASSLASELQRLQEDLVGDGWTVLRHDVSRNDNVANVKSIIRNDYNADSANVKAVFLFGHVPVPYSGNIVPDGHAPDHQGAWPADVYYGDMDGNWTDSSVYSTGATEARNRNVPGDGKFDQSDIPSSVELQVGRVDLANMPGRKVWGGPATFPSELELLRQYLNKDHSFRYKQIDAPRRGLVHDSFGIRGGEAFAASGYRSFAPLVGANNVTTLDNKGEWIPTLRGNSYLWAYGAGAGSFTSIGGLGNTGQYNDGTTVELVEADVKAVFTMLMGSWLGDWDSEDNIMRSVLATKTEGLTCSWSGRPHWFYHHMGLGDNIGYSARLTQNNGNGGLYRNQLNSAAGLIHVALMGDPTLRMHMVAPASGLSAKTITGGVTLNWSASPDSVQGYHVYRAATAAGPFTRVSNALVTSTTFTDTAAVGNAVYMVRAVKLESSPSGTYFNPSQGVLTTGNGTSNPPPPVVDTTAPSANMTAPANNATVSGKVVTMSANAADNVGVVGVQFKMDNTNLGAEAMVAPYQTAWDTTTMGNGSHSLVAVARDVAGNKTTTTPLTVMVNNTTTPPPPVVVTNVPPVVVTNSPGASVVWVEDALPTGAISGGGGGDAWTWVSSNPSPLAGQLASQSNIGQGLHLHYFDWARATLSVAKGDNLFAYVYLDPANLPKEVMLEWNDGTWEHRAYWGENLINNGVNGSAARKAMGALPAAGQWVRLEVPASQVNLEGSTLRGMSFTLYGGRATWDSAGKSTPGSGSSTNVTPPVVVTNVPPVVDTSAPMASGITPVNDATVSGKTVKVSANATDNVGVVGVQFKMDNANLGGEVLAAPYQKIWDTTATTNGAHSLTAVARDAAGNRTTTTAWMVMVSNSSPPPVIVTNTVPPSPTGGTPINVADYAALEMPNPGDHVLHVLTPTLLEVKLIGSKQSDSVRVAQWDLVDTSFQFRAPSTQEFAVTVDGQPVAVQSVGFKRRPLYAPLAKYNLILDNCLYLQLASPVADNQNVEVKNPSGALWASSVKFTSTASALRFSPAIHVNQEGYVPAFPKKAMVGYYLGSMGEMSSLNGTPFKLVDAGTGMEVFSGTLASRLDVGYTYTPTPYQNVCQADFSSFKTPGEYRLLVPGLGASLPFLIDDGIAMSFTRAYALGLYHQRCGTDNSLPYTRHTHDACHTGLVDVPTPSSSFAFTWNTIASKTTDYASNPRHTAPRLQNEATQLYPFINIGKIEVSKGHHDAGDYSRYTINSAGLIHYLTFAVDSFPGVAALDNLGIPESGDGISDLLQEAKWEADYVAKVQDADGGFYFLVYPREREYESNVTPDHDDAQVVWPKTTAVTAASVAALAQIASSPTFKSQYPAEAALYMQKAQLGWKFLTNAIARFGKDGSYQKITHYGNEFMHDDELAWAACQMFLATGDQSYHLKLKEWFDPSDPATLRWGWWRLWESYGRAIRSYAFAARSGRLQASQLDPAYLAKCEQQVLLGAQDTMNNARQSAYGTSFPLETKNVRAAGWYFSSERAFDITVGYQLDARPEFLDAILSNLNYEGGCNPVNVTYVTGLGWKRQREIVHQYAQNDRRVMPPAGIPLGNVQDGFAYVNTYKTELGTLCFPQDGSASAPYPFYDRWGDSFNVSTEFVNLDQARGLASLSFLAALTPLKSQAWVPKTGAIVVKPDGTNSNRMIATLQVPAGLDPKEARILWEARDQEPAYGETFTFEPKVNGQQWIEAEVQWPDGRRVVAATTFVANNPVVVWVEDSLPAGATTESNGGDSWNWVNSAPAPFSGTLAHQSAVAAGLHQHTFDNASSTLLINDGDTLFAYIYLDPANPPTEVMLQWNDGSWEHRAYWGANQINYGTDNTVTRRSMGALPATGKWVRLEVPASQVNLDGKTVKGMAFSLFGGRATWDSAGRSVAGTTSF